MNTLSSLYYYPSTSCFFAKISRIHISYLIVPKTLLISVIPANAGIQKRGNATEGTLWIPAFAGMTIHYEWVAANGCTVLFVFFVAKTHSPYSNAATSAARAANVGPRWDETLASRHRFLSATHKLHSASAPLRVNSFFSRKGAETHKLQANTPVGVVNTYRVLWIPCGYNESPFSLGSSCPPTI